MCNGEIVSRIDVQNYPPFEKGGPAFTQRIAEIATQLHATTKPRVIRRYLELEVGQPCTDVLVRESERILRAQPFLADANVLAVADGNGGVNVTVVTVDEVSLVLDGSFSSKSPVVRAARLGDDNLNGEAIAASAAWQNSTFKRDIYRARIVDYQFLGKPYQFSLQGARNEIGGSWDALVSHPFLTDLQQTSWRASAGANTSFQYFRRPTADDVALQLTRAYADIGGIVAVGPGRVFLLGGTISRERERTARNPVMVRDTGIVPDTSTELIGRYGEHRSARVNLLLGFRHVQYMPVRAFDAVEGTQDVRTGVQFATLIGKGFKITDRDERDYFVSSDLYAGRGSTASFGALEVLSEGRRDLARRRWDGVLTSGRAAWYIHPAPKYTSIFDLEYSGGWSQRVPFQLTFSDREGGLRGYGSSDLGGGQRLVSRLEERYRLGHFRQFAGLAGAAFIDAGKLWAGEAPFGMTTGVKLSAGIGLLAALPPRSRRTWRVDLAVPLNDRGDAKYEIRFTNHDFTRWFWREPGDVQTSRERSIPNSIYNWP